MRGYAICTLGVLAAYLLWRATYTINAAIWWLSVPLLLVEIRAAIGLALFTFGLWDIDVRPPWRAVTHSELRVAVLIPTYNESTDILLPTIASAVRLHPAHETWVLDDGHRPEVARLAAQLGAQYLSRPSNEGAKAGNLNYALQRVDADLIAVFDADHVPAPEFLEHTLGYFDDPRVAIVQTPQDFYNADSFEHEDDFSEERIFYRAIAAGKNRWDAAFWAGTCAVVRTAAIREVGGIATDAITEDILTAMRMQRRGWRVVYHNEVLALGLAPSDAAQYLVQRNRWARGSMQVIQKEGPLRGPGLSLAQRVAYVGTLIGWFDSWRILSYLILPLVVIATGTPPMAAPIHVYGPIFVTLIVLNYSSIWLLARGYFRPRLSLIFAIVQLPAVFPATLTLFGFGGRATFQVTPKGRTQRRSADIPPMLWILGGAAVLGLLWYLVSIAGMTPTSYREPASATGAAVFNLLNLSLIVSAIRRVRSSRFSGEQRASFRFASTLTGTIGRDPFRVLDISVSGLRVELVPLTPFARTVRTGDRLTTCIALPDGDALLACVVRRVNEGQLSLEFEADQAAEIALLVPAIFHPLAGDPQGDEGSRRGAAVSARALHPRPIPAEASA